MSYDEVAVISESKQAQEQGKQFMAAPQVACLVKAKGEHFEGPVFDERIDVVYWVNITAGAFHRLDLQSREEEVFTFDDLVTAVYLTAETDTVILSLKTSWVRFQLTTQTMSPITQVTLSELVRLNDGKVSPLGNIFTGSMYEYGSLPLGELIKLSPSKSEAVAVVDELHITNGMAWDEKSQLFYLIDSPKRTVYMFDWDSLTDELTNQRVAFVFEESYGYPDGMCIDSAGNLWIAMWSGASVCKLNVQSQTIEAVIDVPAKNVTCCVLGGSQGNKLYISTARKDTNEQDLERYPLSGSIFELTLPETHLVKTYKAK